MELNNLLKLPSAHLTDMKFIMLDLLSMATRLELLNSNPGGCSLGLHSYVLVILAAGAPPPGKRCTKNPTSPQCQKLVQEFRS